jgi:acyl carrier protein
MSIRQHVSFAPVDAGSPTFNSIAAILEGDFHLDRTRLAPGVVLSDLGLGPQALMDLVSAVEDAFHHRVSQEWRQPDLCAITLQRLCEVFDGT